jgi:hypothetical protein
MTRLARLLRLLKLYELETDPVRRFRLGACIMQIGAPAVHDPNP